MPLPLAPPPATIDASGTFGFAGNGFPLNAEMMNFAESA
jgi:hypothetical protein